MKPIVLGLNLLPVLLGLVVAQETVNYSGYKVYEVIPHTEEESQALYNYSLANPDVTFLGLTKLIEQPARVVVSPKDQSKFEDIIAKNIKITLMSNDLGETFKKEQHLTPRFELKQVPINFDRYYTAAEINQYMNNLASLHPDRVAVHTVGRSHRNLPLNAITITNGRSGNKKVIFVDGGIHAREWIAPAAAMHVIYQLVENFRENSALLQNYNWVVMPLVNPDGYSYSHTTNRLWRKTLKPNRNCGFGTDANRNFDSHWAEVGTSANGCADTYHGDGPFSEPETQAVRNALRSLQGRTTFYLSLHSYGGVILYPWGFTRQLPSNWRQLEAVANAGANAMKQTTGRSYRVGSITNILYPASGGSMDYAMEKVGIPICLTVEMPFGGSGFDPLLHEIRPLLRESWAGISAMAARVQQLYPY